MKKYDDYRNAIKELEKKDYLKLIDNMQFDMDKFGKPDSVKILAEIDYKYPQVILSIGNFTSSFDLHYDVNWDIEEFIEISYRKDYLEEAMVEVYLEYLCHKKGLNSLSANNPWTLDCIETEWCVEFNDDIYVIENCTWKELEYRIDEGLKK
ncbi:MAG: hypothetical protein ACK5LZ_06200 [Anaerorhabdus sp.]